MHAQISATSQPNMVQPRKMSLRTMRNGTRYSGNRTARTNNSRKPIPTVFLTPNGLERAQKRRPRTGPSQARTIDGCQRSAQSNRRRSPFLRAVGFCMRFTHHALHCGTPVCPLETTRFANRQTEHLFMSAAPRRTARARPHAPAPRSPVSAACAQRSPSGSWPRESDGALLVVVVNDPTARASAMVAPDGAERST